MREIVLDTETTGFKPEEGHRLVEIGCVEIVHLIPTGQHFHRYINPEREVPGDAAAIHGLTTAFLMNHKSFADHVGEFLAFIGDSTLIIHNAKFDMGFLNYQLRMHGFPSIPMDRVVDTLDMARRRFPGSPASLDALCKRFGIDNSNRALHGALLDAGLLAQVYLELKGGKQPGLMLAAEKVAAGPKIAVTTQGRPIRPPRPHAPSEAELLAHAAMLGKLKNPLWAEG